MKVGDKVVYIMQNLPELGLVNGQIYTIYATADCGHCSDGFSIDVGIKLPDDKKFVICPNCANIISIGEEFFLDHSGFRLLEDVKGKLQDAFEKIKTIYPLIMGIR